MSIIRSFDSSDLVAFFFFFFVAFQTRSIVGTKEIRFLSLLIPRDDDVSNDRTIYFFIICVCEIVS